MVGAVLLVLVLSVRFLFLLLVLADIFLPFVICLDGGGGGCGELGVDGGAEVVLFIVC